jgi:hypothetical protein
MPQVILNDFQVKSQQKRVPLHLVHIHRPPILGYLAVNNNISITPFVSSDDVKRLLSLMNMTPFPTSGLTAGQYAAWRHNVLNGESWMTDLRTRFGSTPDMDVFCGFTDQVEGKDVRSSCDYVGAAEHFVEDEGSGASVHVVREMRLCFPWDARDKYIAPPYATMQTVRDPEWCIGVEPPKVQAMNPQEAAALLMRAANIVRPPSDN